MSPKIEKRTIDFASRKVLLSNVDVLAKEFGLTPKEKQLFEDASKAVNALRENPRLDQLALAFGFGCGGVTC